MKEQYIPSSEEVKKAEEMMSPEETKMSKDKEKHNLVVQLSELVTILAHMKWDIKTGGDKGRENVANKIDEVINKIQDVEDRIRSL